MGKKKSKAKKVVKKKKFTVPKQVYTNIFMHLNNINPCNPTFFRSLNVFFVVKKGLYHAGVILLWISYVLACYKSYRQFLWN